MPVSDVSHVERWTILITPDEDEQWPDFKENPNTALWLRPDLITVIVESETSGYMSAIRGYIIQRSGDTGRMRETVRFVQGRPLPEWAAEIIESQLHVHDLYGKAFR